MLACTEVAANATKPTSVGMVTRILASVLGDNEASLRMGLLTKAENSSAADRNLRSRPQRLGRGMALPRPFSNCGGRSGFLVTA